MEKEQIKNSQILFADQIKNWFSVSNWINYVALFGLLMFTVSIGFMINDIVYDVKNNEAWKVFFGQLDRFTDESNILLWVFMLFFVFFPKHSFLKNNKFLIWTMVYIFFTFIGYNVILVGINGYSYSGSSADIAENVWLHILSPIYFLVFGFLVMYLRPNQEPKFLKTLLCGMIYPTIYVIYVITINYNYAVPATDDTGAYAMQYRGEYDSPNHYYTVYSGATNVREHPTAWAYIMVMWLIFFPGFYTAFWYCWKGFNKLNAKKNLSNK